MPTPIARCRELRTGDACVYSKAISSRQLPGIDRATRMPETRPLRKMLVARKILRRRNLHIFLHSSTSGKLLGCYLQYVTSTR